jgi:hypothetical protein
MLCRRDRHRYAEAARADDAAGNASGGGALPAHAAAQPLCGTVPVTQRIVCGRHRACARGRQK